MKRFIISLMLWGLFAMPVMGKSETITITTNDPASIRGFFLALDFEELTALPRRVRGYYETGCAKQLPDGRFVGLFSPPPPSSPLVLTVWCISPYPPSPKEAAAFCFEAANFSGRNFALIAIRDGFTIICGPAGKES